MPDEGRAARVFAAWYDAQEEGAAVAPERLLAAHPDLADDLRTRLLALDLIDGFLGSADPATPRQIGPYRLVRALGSGGMGSVHLAEVVESDAGLAPGSHLALKLLHPHLMARPGFFRRFLREADLGRRVEHANVVRTLTADALVVDGVTHHFLVMEYVEGRTLRALVEEVDHLPESLCRHVATEVAKGLAAIHAAGAVHRDLKPDNVLVTDEHIVKVMDLGVASLAEETLKLSQSGAFVGSLPYAAPEQFRGGHVPVDARADLHALGVLLYESSAGVHPFDDDDAAVVMRRVLDETPRRLGEVNPQLSPFFEELVHCLLAKSPDERFASADELLSVLDEAEASTWWQDRARALRRQTNQPLRRIRIPRETAVYGRDADLDRLAELYRAAKSGDGRVLLLEGEAGIGKTRLVDEFVGRLVAAGEEVHFLFAGYPPGGAATASGAFSSAYREHLGDEDLEESVARVLPDTPLLVPAFTALLCGDAAPRDAVALTKDSLQTCFVHATRNLAAERTTIVLIDDLHFAPEEGLALFTSVALAVPGHRVLLVGTMRPGVPEDWTANVTRLDQTTHAVLARLGPKDLFALLKDSFRSERLAEELGMRIAVKSDGNPFFVFEIIRGLREGQFLRQRHDGTWETTRLIEELEVPSSVLDLVNGRVADLTDEERHLLDLAACWGFEFDPGLIADALGLAWIAALQLLARIEKRHRLVRSAGRRFVFDHHQVQEALYGALPEMLREEYHAALAEALETRAQAADQDPESLDGALCVDLCEHLLKGARGERALRYLAPAALHLEAGYVTGPAVALMERALGVPDLLVGADRAKALLFLCTVNGPLDRLGRREQQEAHAREAARLAEESDAVSLRAIAENAIGWCLGLRSRYAKATEVYLRSQDDARSQGDRRSEAAAASGLGMICLSQSRYAEARGHFEEALAVNREIGDRREEAGCIVNVGIVAFRLYRREEAREHFERGLAICREIGARQFEANAAGNLSAILASQANYEAAQATTEQAIAIQRQIGDRTGHGRNVGILGMVLLAEGRVVEARPLLEQCLVISRETGVHLSQAYAQHNLGILEREVGDTEGCEEHLTSCLTECEKIGHQLLAATSHLALGSLHAAASRTLGGDGTAGRESLEVARDLAREHGFRDIETLASCELALPPGGDAQRAISALDEHEERLSLEQRREARLLLWRSTGNTTHLAEAKRLLDEALAKVPVEYHETMLTNVRVNREIMEAVREAGL